MLNTGSANPGHRSSLGQLLSMWGALPGSMRRFVSDFASVFAEEGRHVPGRLAWSGGTAALAGILLLTGWLFLCAATVLWVSAEYGVPREMALPAVALVNLLLAAIFLIAAYRSVKPPFFPMTSYELHRLRTIDKDAPPNAAGAVKSRPPLSALGPKERALIRSDTELHARISQVKRVTPKVLTKPSVVAATAGVGALLGIVTAKPRPRVMPPTGSVRNVPMKRQLLNVALTQLSTLALALALREVERRAHRLDRSRF